MTKNEIIESLRANSRTLTGELHEAHIRCKKAEEAANINRMITNGLSDEMRKYRDQRDEAVEGLLTLIGKMK